MSRVHIAAAAAAAFLVTASMAQASPFEFRGFYAGGHFGYTDTTADFDSGGNLDDEGVMGGLQAGYNYVWDNFVWGVEIDISGSDITATGTCPYNAKLNCEVSTGLMATARARAGYAVDDFMFYVTGGAAGARFRIDSDNFGTQVDDVEGGAFGWTVGAGVEYLIGDIVGVKLEYRYMKFGGYDFDPFLGTPSQDVDFDIHTVMAGVNFHF